MNAAFEEVMEIRGEGLPGDDEVKIAGAGLVALAARGVAAGAR